MHTYELEIQKLKDDLKIETTHNHELTQEIQILKGNCIDFEQEINQKQEFIDLIEQEKEDAETEIQDLL